MKNKGKILEKYKTTAMFFLVLLTTALIGGFLISSSLGFSPIKQNSNLGDVKFTSIEYIKTKYNDVFSSNTETNATINNSGNASSLSSVINVSNLSDNQLIQVKAIIAANQKANMTKKKQVRNTKDKKSDVKIKKFKKEGN